MLNRCYFVQLSDISRYLRIVPGILLVVAVSVAAVNLWMNDADLLLLLIVAGIIALSLLILFVEYVYSLYEGRSNRFRICQTFFKLVFGFVALKIQTKN